MHEPAKPDVKVAAVVSQLAKGLGYGCDFTPDVGQTSIDEGHFDLPANRKKLPVEIALTIRKTIGQKFKLSSVHDAML